MVLKDLLKATTYDRYTQDGRDKLNEALAEDVRYKTGDISQKTGLQKQPDGSWAPPKKGGAGINKLEKDKTKLFQEAVNAGKTELKKKGVSYEELKANPNHEKLKDPEVKMLFNKTSDMEKRMNAAGAGKPKSNVPGNIPLNNEYYKDDVRTEAGARKILSETKTEAIQSRIKELETLKEKNGGKLGPQGEKELQMNKEELEKRSGNAGPKMSDEMRKGYENHAKKISNESLESLIRNKGKAYVEHGDEIAEIYKSELERRNAERTDILPSGISSDDFSYKQLKEYADGLKESLEKGEGFTDETRAGTEKELAAVEETLKRRSNEAPTDSAPRVLTGDTKIRLRAVTKDCGPRKITGDTKIKLKA